MFGVNVASVQYLEQKNHKMRSLCMADLPTKECVFAIIEIDGTKTLL